MALEDVTRDFGEPDQAAIEAAERDLAALLAVEPSPEFRARVRSRIDAAPEPPGWWKWSWDVATATALLFVVAAGVVWLLTADARRQDSTAARLTTPNVGSDVQGKPDSTGVVNREPEPVGSQPERSASIDVRHIPPAPRSVRGTVVTEVIVDRAQVDAIRRLLAAAARAPRDAVSELPLDPEQAAAIDIVPAPMVLQPLSLPGLDITNKGVER